MCGLREVMGEGWFQMAEDRGETEPEIPRSVRSGLSGSGLEPVAGGCSN